MTLEFLTTIAGATALTALIVEMIKRAWDPPADMQDRFIPLVAVGVGVGVVVFATFAIDIDFITSLELGNAVVTGIFAGFAASGMYDTVQGVRGQ